MSFLKTQQLVRKSVTVAECNRKPNLLVVGALCTPREKGGNKRSSCLLQWSSSTILIQICFINPASMHTPSWQCCHTAKPDTGGGGAGHCLWKKRYQGCIITSLTDTSNMIEPYSALMFCQDTMRHMDTQDLLIPTYFGVSSWHRLSKSIGSIRTVLFPLAMWYQWFFIC